MSTQTQPDASATRSEHPLTGFYRQPIHIGSHNLGAIIMPDGEPVHWAEQTETVADRNANRYYRDGQYAD